MPTIAENLLRLQNAKTAIGNAITAEGGTVTQGDGLEEFVADIGTIVPPINNVVEAANTSIETSLGSGSSALITKSITANCEYTATDDSALGYSSVTVNVPQVLPDNALTPIFTNNVQIITGNVEGV